MAEIAKGSRVYVWADDLAAREVIVKEILKDRQFLLADAPENADFGLIFSVDSEVTGESSVSSASGSVWRGYRYISGVFSSWGITTIDKRYFGEMTVVARGGDDADGNPKVRILWATRKTREYTTGITLNRHPATNSIRGFLKEWKRVSENGLLVSTKKLAQPLGDKVAPVETLANAEVIDMVASGLSEDIIVAKIRSSRCNFDTTVSGLKSLKAAGVSDNIVGIMLEYSKSKGRAAAKPQPSGPGSAAPATYNSEKFVDIEDIANGRYKIGKKP